MALKSCKPVSKACTRKESLMLGLLCSSSAGVPIMDTIAIRYSHRICSSDTKMATQTYTSKPDQSSQSETLDSNPAAQAASKLTHTNLEKEQQAAGALRPSLATSHSRPRN